MRNTNVLAASDAAHLAMNGGSPAAMGYHEHDLDGITSVDPDAQATVTDFLDFTEYLPSDMIRSLTLIGNLDQTYIDASINVDKLSTAYAQLPSLAPDAGPEPHELRAHISSNMSDALNARTLSHAEACRISEIVNRHVSRAKNILSKLQAMAEAYPSSREASPNASPQAQRTPKITLRLENTQATAERVHKRRAPRITVPGEVLAPYDLDYHSCDSGSDGVDSLDDGPLSRTHTPGIPGEHKPPRIRLVSKPRAPRPKLPKVPRAPRPPGVMGTNVHSAVAGISTSNALAQLKPPPPDAQPGSIDAPWLKLTAWELAKLRKRMKKNAVWSPSDTMIARELKTLGRGIEAYRKAGKPPKLEDEFPAEGVSATAEMADGKPVLAVGEISADALGLDDPNLVNRGMLLNEAKKLKKERDAKELAKQAAGEAEESARKMAEAAKKMKNLFAKPISKTNDTSADPSVVTVATPRPPAKTPRKRKRASTVDTETSKTDAEASKLAVPPATRPKIETPIRPPLSTAASMTNFATASIPLAASAAPSASASATNVTASPTSATTRSGTRSQTPTVQLFVAGESIGSPNPTSDSAFVLSSERVSVPILPPGKDRKETQLEPDADSEIDSITGFKREVRKDIRKSGTAVSSRRQTPSLSSPVPEGLPFRRTSRGKAHSVEPVAHGAKARSRRASTVHATPDPSLARGTSKRAKRPAPGPVTKDLGGSAAVSVEKRKAAPRKKAGPKKPKDEKGVPEIIVEVDDEGNIIDPDEPRYCLCNGFSFGVMIGCENVDVSAPRLTTEDRARLTCPCSVRKSGSTLNALDLRRSPLGRRNGTVPSAG